MPTAVVSGRVDAAIKQAVDGVLRRANASANDVINTVWINIARSGVIPTTTEQDEHRMHQQQKLNEFLGFLDSLPSPNPQYADMSDEELFALRDDEYV